MKPVLAVFVYHPTLEINGKFLVKPHHGRAIDEMAHHFERVFWIAPYLDQVPEWMLSNQLDYDYQFQNKNFEIVRGFSEPFLYPFRFFQQFYYLWKSTHALFFTPSVGSLFWIPIGKMLGKKTVSYVSNEISPFFVRKFGVLGKWISKWQVWAISKSDSIFITGANLKSHWSTHPHCERVSPLLNFNPQSIQNPDQASVLRDPKHLVYVGVISERKRIHAILDALVELKKRNKTYRLSICGSYSPDQIATYEKLVHEVREKDLRLQVKFHGYIKDPVELSKVIRSASAFVLLSSYEGFPKAVYESMAFGAVPILSRLPSYQGVLREHENALFVDEPLSTNLVQTLELLESQPDVADRIRSSNAQWFDWYLKRPASAQILEGILR